jgi:hypothetical protein
MRFLRSPVAPTARALALLLPVVAAVAWGGGPPPTPPPPPPDCTALKIRSKWLYQLTL